MSSRHMRRYIIAGAFALAASLSACSSDSTDNGGSSDTSCSITLSGALTGTPSCTPLGTVWTSDGNRTAFGFEPSLGTNPGTLVTIAFTGQPATTTYHDTDAGAVAGISVNSATSQWAMQTADGSTPATGSFTLVVTSVKTVTSTADVKAYLIHGTLTATLPPAAGTATTGTVTLKATF